MRAGSLRSRGARRGLIAGLALAPLLALVLVGCSKEGDPDLVDTGLGPTVNVLVVHSVSNSQRDDVGSKLLATGVIATVDAFDARRGTPLLAELQAYDAVLVMSNLPLDAPEALGDVLADYVDAGGGVVLSMFSVSDSPPPEDTPGGRFDFVISQSASTGDNDGPHGMTALIPGHPILDGVGSFGGGSRSYRPAGATVVGDTVAVWDDDAVMGLEAPLVAVRETGEIRRVDLGFFPPTTDSGLSFLTDPDSDALRIVANALRWVAGEI